VLREAWAHAGQYGLRNVFFFPLKVADYSGQLADVWKIVPDHLLLIIRSISLKKIWGDVD
jgi:hypothetical protein